MPYRETKQKQKNKGKESFVELKFLKTEEYVNITIRSICEKLFLKVLRSSTLKD